MSVKRLHYALYDPVNKIIVYGELARPKEGFRVTNKIKNLIAGQSNILLDKKSARVFIKEGRINDPVIFVRNKLNLPSGLLSPKIKKINISKIMSSH